MRLLKQVPSSLSALNIDGILGDIIASFPRPVKGREEKYGSWPLSYFPPPRPPLQPPTSSPVRSGLARVTSPQPISPHKPPTDRQSTGMVIPRFDKGDRPPTRPLVINKEPLSPGQGRRKCCGMRLAVFLCLIIAAALIVIVATVIPIVVLRAKHSTPTHVTVQQCQMTLSCQNGGASILVDSSAQCSCVCAAGFTGTRCENRDSACVAVQGGNNNTVIGSAIAPLIRVAETNFTQQFNLSMQRLVHQFAAANVSCTSQNSLVNLNGTTSALLNTESLSNLLQEARDLEQIAEGPVATHTSLLTVTHTTTLPLIVTSESTSSISFNTSTTTQTPTSTISLHTGTINTTTTQTGLSPRGLVFGRCVILVVVQEFGVQSAAKVQEELQSAVLGGNTVVRDSVTGLTIDLTTQTILGLSKAR